MINERLSEKLFEKLKKFRKKVDWIADREVRQQVDELATQIYLVLKEHAEKPKVKEDK